MHKNQAAECQPFYGKAGMAVAGREILTDEMPAFFAMLIVL
jgi:hypothetical protein